MSINTSEEARLRQELDNSREEIRCMSIVFENMNSKTKTKPTRKRIINCVNFWRLLMCRLFRKYEESTVYLYGARPWHMSRMQGCCDVG